MTALPFGEPLGGSSRPRRPMSPPRAGRTAWPPLPRNSMSCTFTWWPRVLGGCLPECARSLGAQSDSDFCSYPDVGTCGAAELPAIAMKRLPAISSECDRDDFSWRLLARAPGLRVARERSENFASLLGVLQSPVRQESRLLFIQHGLELAAPLAHAAHLDQRFSEAEAHFSKPRIQF